MVHKAWIVLDLDFHINDFNFLADSDSDVQIEDGSNENNFESSSEHDIDSFSESEIVANNSNSEKDLVQPDELDDPEYVD